MNSKGFKAEILNVKGDPLVPRIIEIGGVEVLLSCPLRR
jgi:hypothetical protein